MWLEWSKGEATSALTWGGQGGLQGGIPVCKGQDEETGFSK